MVVKVEASTLVHPENELAKLLKLSEVFREIPKLGTGFKDGAFLTFVRPKVKDFVVVVSVFVNVITTFGGIITQLPLLVTEHAEFDIYIIEGTVIDTVPVGDCAGKMYEIDKDMTSLFL